MTVADLGVFRQGGEGVLVCPACGDDGMLMISATTVWGEQGEEDVLAVHVDMDGMRCAQKKRAEHDIIVSILLHCEECAKEMRLEVAERDGQTFVSMTQETK